MQRLPLVPGPDNRPENTKRIHLQRSTVTRAAAGRTKPQEKPRTRADTVPRTIL